MRHKQAGRAGRRQAPARGRLADHPDLLAHIFESAPDAQLLIDSDGRIVELNSQAIRLFGYEREELIGAFVENLLPERFLGRHVAHRSAYMATPCSRPMGTGLELLARLKNGSELPVDIMLSPLETEQGTLILAVVRDITGRKKAEAEARKSRLQKVLSLSPAIIFALKLEGETVTEMWVSDNVKPILGFEPADTWNPQWWFSNVHPEDLEEQSNQIPDLLKLGHLVSEYRFRDGFEKYRWIRDEKRLVRDADGHPTECIGSWSDITDQRRLAAERDELLSRLQLQIERMPLAYVLCDADLRITDWNPAAERIFGYTKAEVLGMGPPFEKITTVHFREEGETILGRIRAGDKSAHSVNENLTRDGKIIICEWLNTPLLSGDGQFLGLLCLGQDVTEHKKLEEQFRQAQKMEVVGTLAGGIAHDFNNLLTVISGYSGILLSTEGLDEDKKHLIKEIEGAGERAATLTRQLLALSRKQVLEPRVLDLNRLISELEKMLVRLIGEDVVLTTVFDPALKPVQADPPQIEQVIMNLAVNARDAMPQGGQLTIETGNVELDEAYAKTHAEVRPGQYAMFAVSDTGGGMSPEVMAHLFEPFFTTKEPGRGTGLGLATVYGIVKQSGGHVGVYSEPGAGATFKIYLPASEVQQPSEKVPVGVSPMPKGSETILLVEDENAVRAISRHVLQSCGYQVLEASDGTEALRRSNQYPGHIHLVITDVVMPRMSGRMLAEQLAENRPGTRVLYMSGYTDDAVIRHGVLHAQTAFLQKPFTPFALTTKVREVLDR